MTRLIVSPIDVPPDTIVAVDLGRRVFLGLSRDGSYLHVVHPRGFEMLGEEGELVGRPEDLVCTCAGSFYHGRCYQTQRAEAIEAELDAPATAAELAWFGAPGLDSPAGAGEQVEAFRG